MTTVADVQNRTISLSDYEPHPRNYNRHPEEQIRRIATSLQKFGQVRSVVVWNGRILAGHGVVQAAQGLGWQSLRADVLPDSYPEHLALAYVAADNELGRLADPDYAQLAEILDESRQTDEELLKAIGYSEEEFQQLISEIVVPDFESVGIDEQPRLDQKVPVLCPHCGREFIPQ